MNGIDTEFSHVWAAILELRRAQEAAAAARGVRPPKWRVLPGCTKLAEDDAQIIQSILRQKHTPITNED